MSSVNPTNDWIDGSLYPDKPVPQALNSLPDKVDFLVRVCAAWDFGMPPKTEVLNEILQVDGNRWWRKRTT
ncbi:MAG: hypothetical protein ACE5IY_16350 [bacterium]